VVVKLTVFKISREVPVEYLLPVVGRLFDPSEVMFGGLNGDLSLPSVDLLWTEYFLARTAVFLGDGRLTP
jgi:hypothetical protein